MLNAEYTESGCRVYNTENVFVVGVFMFKVTFLYCQATYLVN